MWCDAATTHAQVSYCKVALLSNAFRSRRSALLPWIDVLGHESAFATISARRTRDLAQYVGRERVVQGLTIRFLKLLDLSDELCHWLQLLITCGAACRCSACDSSPANWSKQAYGSGSYCGPLERYHYFLAAKRNLAHLLPARSQWPSLRCGLNKCNSHADAEAFAGWQAEATALGTLTMNKAHSRHCLTGH